MNIRNSGVLKEKGFTLVELLVVIAIIGILATLVLLQLGTARAKARDTQRITAVNQITSAVELYYGDNGVYPTGITSALIGPTSPGKYLTNVPVDPATGVAYFYAYNPAVSPRNVQVWAELENRAAAMGSDADINSTGWSGAPIIGGAPNEACTSAAPTDCVYDLGNQ